MQSVLAYIIKLTMLRMNMQTGKKKSTRMLNIDFSRYSKHSRELNPEKTVLCTQ